MKKGGLGTGLGDLLGLNSINTYDDEGQLNHGIEEVAIEKIITNPDQPRKRFDADELNDLATSIKNYGLIQPIIVCAMGDKFQIVAGERRFRACNLAGLKKIPIIIKDYSSQQKEEIALIENLQRKDLNPIEEAKAYKSLIDKYNFTQEILAEKLGKSRPVITNALRLLTLSPVVVDMVLNEKLSAGHARALAAIKEYPVQASYALAACNKGMSVRQLEIMVSNYLKPQEEKKPIPQVITPELKDLVKNMQHIFGTKIKAVGNNDKGRIFIDYYTQTDLNKIYDLMDKLKG